MVAVAGKQSPTSALTHYISLANGNIAGAAAESAQWNPAINHVLAHAVAARDDHCAELPKLCTDAVLLRGYETTLTYLCPEKTEGPSTVTVTTTRTTTVTGDQSLTSSVAPAPAPTSDVGTAPSAQPLPHKPVSATSDVGGPPAEEPTTTVIIQSTVQVTITRSVIKVTPSSTSSSLPPPSITWSFTAVLPTDVKSSHVSGGSSSASRTEVPSIVSSVGPPSSSKSRSLVFGGFHVSVSFRVFGGFLVCVGFHIFGCFDVFDGAFTVRWSSCSTFRERYRYQLHPRHLPHAECKG
ncbi:hypothetical protein J4E85_006272 [Alternaria conjuncta]|uniref:uncharacterized protein n=1 Tax=Alternaria conjuncta TaxID=181017 RepID=UPI00222001D7|nr:uncharacterized protein J4E85_006272 [Alternaria conjuncta]KAI4927760.1 hypothetical protein J4E85_006272 [Alternaria conjuncta]